MPAAIYVDAILEALGVRVQGGFDISETAYQLPDIFLQLGAESFDYPLYEERPNVHFIGPLMPRLDPSTKAPSDAEDILRAICFWHRTSSRECK